MNPERGRWIPFLILAAMWFVVALIVVPTWGWTYWDFGDGNYLYTARRVREGLVLYKDILAPQPPLHIIAGMVSQVIGKLVFHNELFGVRAYCLLSRFAASLALFLIARRLFTGNVKPLIATAIYLFLPIGFWWSLSYESENLEIVFLLFAQFFLIRWDRNGAIIAGVLSALACHCNMTAVPYLLVNVIFLVFRIPRLTTWYASAGAAIYVVCAIAANIWTEGAFVGNVLLNQVGTFPRTDILSSGNPGDTFLRYAYRKITNEGWKILEFEGGFIAAAFVGMIATLRRIPFQDGDPIVPERAAWLRTEYLCWSAIGLMLSICFTAKGGTVNYIFCLGEPAVALFAAEALCLLWCGRITRLVSIKNTQPVLNIIAAVVVTYVIFAPAVQNLRFTLTRQQVELPESGVAELRNFIETYATPGDEILAPPFYAYATRTHVSAELAENYIWQIKYMNEMFDGQNYGKPTADGVAKMNELTKAIEEERPRVILLDSAQTGRVESIAKAIKEHYQRADPPKFQTRNTTLELWVPKKK